MPLPMAMPLALPSAVPLPLPLPLPLALLPHAPLSKTLGNPPPGPCPVPAPARGHPPAPCLCPGVAPALGYAPEPGSAPALPLSSALPLPLPKHDFCAYGLYGEAQAAPNTIFVYTEKLEQLQSSRKVIRANKNAIWHVKFSFFVQ